MSLNVTEIKHALALHHLAKLRARDTTPADFRRHIGVLASMLVVEATRELAVEPVTIQTPLEEMQTKQLSGRIAAVPILRAGLGMLEPTINMIPDAETWHLGLYRDEATAQPVSYYDKLPDSDPVATALVLDPMLATGGSAALAIERLKSWGVPKILMLSVIAAPEGIERLNESFPDVAVFTCAVDRELNEQKFIMPGLGDAGDRIFNT